MNDHTLLKEWDEEDGCPRHGASFPVKKAYDFGAYADATVLTFRCGCAVCERHADILSDATYHTSYNNAAGRARLIVAGEAVKDRMVS